MAYKTLLLPLFDEDDADNVLDVATAIARRHQAHLIGLNPVPSIEALGFYDMALSASIATRWVQDRREAAERLKARFEKATDGETFGAEWRLIEGVLDHEERIVADIGHVADLVILGQHGEGRHRAGRGSLNARVLSRCARPVLVVPRTRTGTTVGTRCFVGWDGKRASSRALFGALPMLRCAEAVRVQRVFTPANDHRDVLDLTKDLASMLARHGVSVDIAKSGARTAEIGQELLGAARDWGADTFVSGAYEKPVVHDYLFGSTTRYLLENAGMPLVMCT